MKKVLIGILILIPIIILLVVALVSNLLQLQVWIPVEDISLMIKDPSADANLKLYLNVGDDTIYDIYDWVDIEVTPDKANNYTIEWSMSNVECSDDSYSDKLHDAATMVDSEGRDAEVNTSGKFKVYAYCSFNLSVRAETVKKDLLVEIVGNTVHNVALTDTQGNKDASLTVGESTRLCASYVPLDSVVTQLRFEVSDTSVLSVDENGVITALGEGRAQVRAFASKYDENGEGKSTEFVPSNEFFVTVAAGAGAYGDNVTVVRTQDGKYSFEQLGISAADVEDNESADYTVEEDGIVLNGESAQIALKGGKQLGVELCEADEIVIDHAALYGNDSGFILGVDENESLKLGVKYAATADLRTPESAVWHSSNEAVATVDANGLVKGISDGVVNIAATVGDFKTELLLNVKAKTTSLRLKNSNDTLEVGLARQTVFASDVYVYETDAEGGARKNDKKPNSYTLRIHGEPEDGNDVAAFYDRYTFEIVEGKEFAHMDASVPNMVVFDGEALKGKGIVQVTVAASAKYPRFEANTAHTTDEVVLDVVYGVSVSNAEQVVRASADQKAYIMQPAVMQTPASIEDTLKAPDGKEYDVFNAPRFSSNYAMVLVADIACPEDKHVEFNNASAWCVTLYGDLYGNGHVIQAESSQIVDWSSYLVHVMASDVTVSNVTIRHENMEITTISGDTFKNSYCMVYDPINDAFFKGRQQGERIEYCILENTNAAIELGNTDITVDGCIFRNISSCGIYGRCRVEETDAQIFFDRLTLNNSIFSSIISTSLSFGFENFALKKDGSGRFSASGDIEESYKWAEENLVPKKYTHCLYQTGFLDIYNWQNSADVMLVKTGISWVDPVIAELAGPIITQHPDFAPGVVKLGDIAYFHLGFITSGISDGRMNERTFLYTEFADNRFFTIKTRTMSADVPGLSNDVAGRIRFLINGIELTMYSYRKDSALTPESTYQINNQLIDHLHSSK